MERVDKLTNIAASPYCREIRSKKVFTLGTIPMAESDLLDPSGHCWCRQTKQVIGPDGGYVQPKDCIPGRGCYRSHFDHRA